MQVTLDIPTLNIPAFVKSFNKLVKAAEKCGCDKPTWTCVDHVVKEVRIHPDGPKRKVEFSIISVSGDAPVLGEYQVIAKVDPMDGGNVIRGAEHVDTRFRHTGTVCEHCNTKRNRVYLYVVQDTDGNQIQVGKSCLKDFVGHKAPEALLQYFQWWNTEVGYGDEDYPYGFSRSKHEDLVSFLGWVAATTHAYGWKSAGQAYEEGGIGTAMQALEVMEMNRRYASLDKYNRATVDKVRGAMRESDEHTIQSALEWIRGMDAKEVATNQYYYNLQLVCSQDVFDFTKHTGIVGSLLVAYAKHLESVAADKARAEKRERRGPGKHIGLPKERIRDVTVKVTKHRELDGEFGVTHLFHMETKDGALLVWFGSGERAHNLADALDQYVTIDATVQSHEVYCGTKQTRVNRVNWAEA